MSKTSYSSESIEVLTGLEPVRKRPGMYTDTTRPNHLVQEVVDNSVDEALNKHASTIEIILHSDGSITVTDDGRGMPVDVHKEHQLSGVELILTKLHAGAKFSNKEYNFSGGLHGVGVSVVCALSKKLEVWVKRDGKIYYISFIDGEKEANLKVLGKTEKNITGTTIKFLPNSKYFDSPKVASKPLKHLLRAKAVLCPGLRITFFDESNNDRQEWYYEQGMAAYLNDNTSNLSLVLPDFFLREFKTNKEEINFAIAWSIETDNLLQESYVNLVPTIQGGTHVNGLRTGILEAVREFCELRNLLPKGIKLTADDIWQGINFVLSIKMHDPQFAGQTKERLSSREIAAIVQQFVKDAFSLWLNEHLEEAQQLCNVFIEYAGNRLKAGKMIARKKATQGLKLPGKLADCLSNEPMAGELFLVEGESAGGSAKQARNKEFQAVMPLRGKILNTWEVGAEELFSHQEISDIATALGIEPHSDNLDNLRYGKVCILADADSDGQHIAVLLAALFLKHFPILVQQGHVFIAQPPLYRIDSGNKIYYALDEAEKEQILNKISKNKAKVHIQRFKGLGEMNPLQLRETTMHPDTRRLVQLFIDDALSTSNMFDMLLAKKRASDRKSWLEAKGNLADV